MRALALAGLLVLLTAAAADARRIVSIGGAMTEIAFALGAEDEIVAVDTTSLRTPDAVRELAKSLAMIAEAKPMEGG